MADAFWTELFAQSQSVMAEQERIAAKREREWAQVEESVLASVRKAVTPTRPPDTHKFSPYGNTGLSTCVRCPYPRSHPIHEVD